MGIAGSLYPWASVLDIVSIAVEGAGNALGTDIGSFDNMADAVVRGGRARREHCVQVVR